MHATSALNELLRAKSTPSACIHILDVLIQTPLLSIRAVVAQRQVEVDTHHHELALHALGVLMQVVALDAHTHT